MALKIAWSKKADKKFDKILDFLQQNWGDKATSSFVKRVYDFLDILSRFPEIETIENRDREI